MRIKISVKDRRPRCSYGYGWWGLSNVIRKITLLSRIEQTIFDNKGLYAYAIAYINIILTLNIPNIERIYSTKRIWYG